MSEIQTAKTWGVLPYNTERIRDRYLISTHLGSWDLLTREEFKDLERLSLEEDSEFFKRLYDKGIIVKEDNVSRVVHEYRNLQASLFSDAFLHIAVLTTRCNIACHYCQTRGKDPCDMDVRVAQKVLDYCSGVRSPFITLEFQGGEPLMNWDTLKFFVERVNTIRSQTKKIRVCFTTNGLLLDDEKIDFLLDHGMGGICISLDGPADVHDRHRVFSGGEGTYAHVAAAITRLKEAYRKRGKDKPMDLIPTIHKESLPFAKEIIDEYVKWGVNSIALRPINQMGGAQCRWETTGYSPEEFNQFWAEAMDYILTLNKQGIAIQERMAAVMLTKILKKKEPGYVDLMSPCGAGRSVVTYMPNGDVYPCDEARMADSDMFRLGNVMTDSYEDVIKRPKFFSMCESSVMDLWRYNSAFLPWMGTCPVLNYMTQGNIVPKITQTPMYKMQTFQLTYLFRAMTEDRENLDIFQKWVQ